MDGIVCFAIEMSSATQNWLKAVIHTEHIEIEHYTKHLINCRAYVVRCYKSMSNCSISLKSDNVNFCISKHMFDLFVFKSLITTV